MDRSITRGSLRIGMGLVVAGLLAAACGGGSDDAATTTTTDVTTTTTDVDETTTTTSEVEITTTTEVEATTTTEVATTVAATDPPDPPPGGAGGGGEAPFVLRSNGIGPYDFFLTEAPELLPALEVFGPIVVDVYDLYVTDGGSGYITEDGDLAYTYPFGREVCYSNGLCIEFGGAAAPIVFTGWRQIPPTSGSALATAAGITVGSRWSDNIGRMDVFEGGCYAAGSGLTADGVQLGVVSSGTMFGDFTPTGEYVAALPAPTEVTVDSLFAGELKVFLFADC